MTIEITEVRNAMSLQSDNLRMEVEINHPQHGWIPYGLDPADTDTTIDNAAVVALIGTDFAAYVAPTKDELDAALAAEVRADRDERLTEVDAIAGNALRWSELDAETQAAWAAYRQALLDVPQQAGFPNTVTWPTKP
jgi:agmatine/peptidylarginine deiminase|tara:strand:- start:2626 stop:3036 length:411 start_codon:yes stop_codon:yes gene_type:complete